mmetsp:Transcript_14433/g.27139  ORF Transcript_14433/g.27139 Transcript_14433/m.27139 type:complete len:999 (+) Transcript_14433:817-3813(+)
MTMHEKEEDLSQRVMAELALSLQMQTQSCHDEIGRIGAELRAIVPRCSADLSRLKLGIENLKEDAKTLLEAHVAHRGSSSHGAVLVGSQEEDEEKKEQGEEENCLKDQSSIPLVGGDHDDSPNHNPTSSSKDQVTDEKYHDDNDDKDDDNLASSTSSTPASSFRHTAALETLSTLHALKHNLNCAKQVLVAASTYNQTLAKIPSLLNPSTIHQCVQAWMELEHGAKALSGMPGKTQRQAEIQKIRQEILTLLKPVLLHALNKVDSRLGPFQTCVSLYQSLGEMSSLMDEYVKVRPSSVHKLWFDYRKLQVDKRNVQTNDNTNRYNEEDDDEEEEAKESLDNLSMKQEDDDDNDPSKTFITWLPTWYDAVLVLLSEERRRSHAIFGAEHAPEVMVKVLNECFRPIYSSFEKRLATLCGVDLSNSGGSGGDGQSFDAICRAYASTMQFLSVAYEQMVDFDNNTTSSFANAAIDGGGGGSYDTPARHKTPVQLHFLTLNAFVTIASPFVAHQRNFAALESNYSGTLTRDLSMDLHKAVSGRILSSSEMRESVDKLASTATLIFPMVQGSLARFELMKCGFAASDGLDTIDKILSSHFGELSISFHTLLANTLSNQKTSDPRFSNGFDEQQIHCALDVLKIAGEIRSNLEIFHAKVRDRLSWLAGRIEAAAEQNVALSEALEKRMFNSNLVPDSLSVSDVEVLLATSIHGDVGDGDNTKMSPSVTTLRTLSTAVDENDKSMFPKTLDSLNRLIKNSQLFVFEICAAVPLQILNEMHTLPVWSKNDNMLSHITSSSYGTLPQSYMTQIGEHLLALVQALEPFASDKNALNAANSVMGGIEHINMKYWRNFAHVIRSGHDHDDVIHFLRKGENMKNLILSLTENEMEEEVDILDDNEIEAQKFCNQWLDVICSSVTGLLLEKTMRIEFLSPKGCEHLCTDLNYIINVLTALGVSGHPHPLLIHILELTKLSAEELESRIVDAPDDIYSLKNIETRLLQMRLALR